MSAPCKAWLVWSTLWPEMRGIVSATTRGQAKVRSWAVATELGYESLLFTTFRARRLPSLDEWANTHEGMRASGTSAKYVPGGEAAVAALIGVAA